jgi:hypothetical protein
MGNVYKDFRDDIIHREMDAMHARLRSGTGSAPFRGTDRSKPSLDSAPPAPLKIKNAVPQRITLRMPWE